MSLSPTLIACRRNKYLQLVNFMTRMYWTVPEGVYLSKFVYLVSYDVQQIHAILVDSLSYRISKFSRRTITIFETWNRQSIHTVFVLMGYEVEVHLVVYSFKIQKKEGTL